MAVLSLGGPVFGAEYYVSDESAYWWWVDGNPQYEVKVPSNAYAYPQVRVGGATILQVPLKESGGPLIVIGNMPGNNPQSAFQSLTGLWAASLRNTRTTENSVITTERGLRPRFMVLTGTGEGSTRGMVRMVAFTKDNRIAYLLFVGEEKDYAGDARQIWLKAVHSFSWL